MTDALPKILCDVKAVFRPLPLHEQRLVLQELMNIYEEGLETRRSELREELRVRKRT